VLLTTPRHRGAAPAALVHGSAAVLDVPSGLVDEIAAALRPAIASSGAEVLVALGGGRVIDVAKALAAAEPPRRVAAIPTTLSAAEMTPSHRHAAGVPASTPRVRPAIVVNDPALCASQPEAELAASALNALAHAVEAPLTTLANPVATLAAHEAAQLIAGAFGGDGQLTESDRDALALGALLSGYAMGSTGYGLHHVASQTLVREAGVGHAQANAVMLPWTIDALAGRAPAAMAAIEAAIGVPPRVVAERIAARTGATRLRDLGVARDALDACARAAAARAELAMTPPPAGVDELRELYDAAW
jgi:alcohol dehydrogenase class IV